MNLIKLTCCAAMEANCRSKTTCVPSITSYNNNIDYYIQACDGDLADYPIRFCPWCGVSIEAQASKQREE